MRTRHLWQMLTVSAVAFVIGCGSSNKGKIEGTKWVATKGSHELEFDKEGNMKWKYGGYFYDGKYILGGGRKVTFKLNQEFKEGGRELVKSIKIDNDPILDSEGNDTGKTQLTLWLDQDQFLPAKR